MQRAVEFVVLFFGVTGLYIAAHIPGGPIPVLLVAAAGAYVYLRRAEGFDNRTLWRAEALRPALPRVIGLWLGASLLGLLVVALADRPHLFDLPGEHPWLWLAILVFYPLASVYPQELVFRAFLSHRYAVLFKSDRMAAAAGAAAFGFVHLLFGNVLAVLATLAGGWLFARRYQRTRSLLVVSVEHALYGATLFTIGLGRFFYHAGHF
jgi:uncharacterized protein